MRTSSALQKKFVGILEMIAKGITIGALVTHFARFLFIAFSRIAFPFSLEWMEGGSFVQVSRILAGQSLYVRPSFDFIPQIYPPVYFYISALFSKFLGNSFLPLRLVSIIATLGTLYLIFILVYKHSGSKLGGYLASGLFCATYGLSGHWFDIARVDSLALVLLFFSAYFLLKDGLTESIAGGLLLALSCFTKQTMLLMAGIFIIYCLFSLCKNNLIFSGTAVLAYLGGTLVLDWLHEGWYSYYIFHLPGRHRVIPNIIALIPSINDILFEEMIKPIFFAMLVGLLYLFVFPARMNSTDNELTSLTWQKRAARVLVIFVGLLAFASIWFLASLPSDSEGGLIGPYSMARLLLIAGQVVMAVVASALAIMMFRDDSWTNRIASLIYGKPQSVPQLVLVFIVSVFSVVIILAHVRPGLISDLSTAHLQRLFPYLAGPILMLILMVVLWRFLWPSTRIETWFFLLLGFGLVGSSWLGRLNPGGYYNVFMPAHAGVSILFGLGIGTLYKKTTNGISTSKKLIGVLILILSSVQLITLLSPPAAQIPTRADKQAGQELVKRIRTCPGNVYIPFHTYLAKLAGKDGYAGVVEMGELRGSFGGRADPLWDEVLGQIRLALDSQVFSAIIQDNQIFRDAMSPYYIESGTVFQNELVFWPMTGRKIRPETIYEPINSNGCLLTTE